MKLTKGRIHKLLSIRKQTFKRCRGDSSSNKEKDKDTDKDKDTEKEVTHSHNFTVRNKKPMNLMKKSLHNYKSINK
jgi:hypothetical protein